MATKAPPHNPDAADDEAPVAPRIIASDDVKSAADNIDAPTTHADRVAAYHAQHVWHGSPLNAFSIKRESLFDLARRFMPLGFTRLPGQYDDEYRIDAFFLLWICSADDQEIKAVCHSADAMWDKVFAWAERHVDRSEWQAAGELAFQILRETRSTLAVARPDGAQVRPGN